MRLFSYKEDMFDKVIAEVPIQPDVQLLVFNMREFNFYLKLR